MVRSIGLKWVAVAGFTGQCYISRGAAGEPIRTQGTKTTSRITNMTMKKLITLAAVATGLGLASMTGVAAEPNSACSTIVFHKEFLDKYPMAPAVCRQVDVKNGVKSAKFSAKILDLDKGSVKVQFLNVAGNPVAGMEPLTFTPAAGAKLTVNGKSTKYSELKNGDSLNFWVSENRVGILTDMDSEPAK
jgi:hypothetical protein